MQNAYGIEIAALRPGDVIVVEYESGYQEEREVVRVVDPSGARGGIVDTKPVGGRHSRSNGFRLGDEIVEARRIVR